MEDKNKEKINVVELFGSNVFNDKIMRERLPKKVYKELHKTIDEGKELDPITAEVVAGAMKDWAVEKGATHYTHWFQQYGVFGKRADQRRTGCFFFPVRRAESNL